jgi:hypothetical protein
MGHGSMQHKTGLFDFNKLEYRLTREHEGPEVDKSNKGQPLATNDLHLVPSENALLRHGMLVCPSAVAHEVV